MLPFTRHPGRILKLLTISLLALLLAWGMAMTFFEIRPFWIDEWRLIYNIKFKSPEALWGPLDYTQQFPRVFLQVIKRFTAAQDYSYRSFRFPSLILSAGIMVLCYRLMSVIFDRRNPHRFLFVLILVSSETFTEYIVQMKQYEMEILLSLVAIWQLLELLRIWERLAFRPAGYLLLCLSFLAVPFFSYTYPIAAAPVFLIGFLLGMRSVRRREAGSGRGLFLLWLPLALGAAGILGFYRIDVSQLMADQQMHRYWAYRMIDNGFSLPSVTGRIWSFFAEVGSGALYEIIFGSLGIVAFGYGFYRSARELGSMGGGRDQCIRLYCVSLVLLVILLFLAGKLPVGEPKFNAFTVPAISILIIRLLQRMRSGDKLRMVSTGIATVLFIGLAGNIISTVINTFLAPEYEKRVQIYRQTEKAINTAQAQGLPILVTPGVAWPDQITREVPFLVTITADVVLKTWPAYPAEGGVPVYAVMDSAALPGFANRLPPGIPRVMAGNGLEYKVYER